MQNFIVNMESKNSVKNPLETLSSIHGRESVRPAPKTR